MIGVEFGEYNGFATISLPLDEKGRTFAFGVTKAKAIIKYIEDIKKFVEKEEKKVKK